MGKTRIYKGISAIAAAAVLFAALVSCSAQSGGANPSDTSKPNPKLKTVVLSSGEIRVTVELARTELERNRGLMYRKTLEEGKGMLFVFEQDQRIAFWMRNTSIPLSLAYIGSDGTIFQILDLVPFSEEARLSERSVRYALEVPQGWFAKAGIKVGDKIDMSPVR